MTSTEYTKTPNLEDIEIRNEYTGAGHDSFSPWNDTKYKFSIGQLYQGSNALSKLYDDKTKTSDSNVCMD